MPAYKPPTTAFGRVMEREFNKMTIDFALGMGWMYGDTNEKRAEIIDKMIYDVSFWECVPQEVMDCLRVLEGMCLKPCPDCKSMMTRAEIDENMRRCTACENMPYWEWCRMTDYEGDKDADDHCC